MTSPGTSSSPTSALLTTLPIQLEESLRWLQQQQQADGSFASWSSPHLQPFQATHMYTTTLMTSLIVNCLSQVTHPLATTICHQGISFLLANRSSEWTWNYWPRQSPQSTTHPYPDDLDDTFLALTAIHRCQPELITGDVLAQVVTLLTTLEKQPGGPYYTWLVAPISLPVWRDVDVAVNANIATFLAHQHIALPHVVNFIESALQSPHPSSTYYPSPFPIWYFVSQWYRGPLLDTVTKHVLACQLSAGHWQTPLETALALSTLLNFSYPAPRLTKTVSQLMNSGDGTDHWPAAAICLDPTQNGLTYYAGSPALTTALVIEAASHWTQAMEAWHHNSTSATSLSNTSITPPSDATPPQLTRAITQTLEKRFRSVPSPLQEISLHRLHRLLDQDSHHHLTQWPAFFQQVVGPAATTIPDSFLVRLGSANVLGWLAFTIYDDFLDDEGQVPLLSVANVCLRELTTLFTEALPTHPNFKSQFKQLMDKLDAANSWEVATCRASVTKNTVFLPQSLPVYSEVEFLSHRSLGVALTPLALLMFLGFKKNAPVIKSTLNFMKHYLTAKQLDDDAHDWEQDLKKGHLTYAVTELLKDWSAHHRQPLRLSLSDHNLLKLQTLFWEVTMVRLAATIQNQVRLARRSLTLQSDITRPELLDQVLVPLESSAQQALLERQRMLDFLKKYQP